MIKNAYQQTLAFIARNRLGEEAMAEYDGPRAYENAFPEQPAPDFFEVGHEYDDGDPYTAPETIRVFRCLAIDQLPNSGAQIALGLMATGSLPWGGTGMGPRHWSEGWRDRGPWTTEGETET